MVSARLKLWSLKGQIIRTTQCHGIDLHTKIFGQAARASDRISIFINSQMSEVLFCDMKKNILVIGPWSSDVSLGNMRIPPLFKLKIKQTQMAPAVRFP